MKREKRLEKAQMRVVFACPFFAPGVMRLPVIFDDKIPTACTDGQVIRWGPKFFDSLDDGELVTVLCHEVWHCMAGHLWRAPAGADWRTWNEAIDHATNLMLTEYGETVVASAKNRIANPFPFPKPKENYCCDPQFHDTAEETIYHRLFKQKQGGAGNKPGQGNPGGNPGAHSMPSFGDIEQPQNVSPDQQAAAKQLANDWQATLLQAARIAKGQGTLPGSIERLVSDITENKIPWPELLRSFLREQCADDWNWLAPAMEYEGSGFILPTLKSERMGPVVFATDTSGSIDGDLLGKFRAEKQACLDTMRPRKLVDIYCDAKIQAVSEYESGDIIARNAPGGGGTSFVPVFKYALDMAERPKCIVYLTDLLGDFPAVDPGIPTVWVVWGGQKKAPFGEVINVED